jgi:hypothetical protein
MGFAQDSGYTPSTVETLMLAVMEGVNTQFGTTYTAETFIGTNFYKYFYALIQRLQENEVKTSEIFLKLQQYFATTNERILRPVATSPGVIEALETAGYTASVKPMVDANAGKIHVCVDVDSGAGTYATTKLAINTIIKNSIAAGVVSQGTESSSIVLSNGQSFDFKYALPDTTAVHLKLTITLSDNNQSVILSPEAIKDLLLENIAAKYRLGRDFEPQRYFSTADAPWASAVLLEYSLNAGSSWLTAIYDSDYDELFEFDLANITLVEN